MPTYVFLFSVQFFLFCFKDSFYFAISQLLTGSCQLSPANCWQSTLNSQLSAANCKQSTLSCQHSTVNCKLPTVSSQHSAVNTQLSTVSCQHVQSTFNCFSWYLYKLQCNMLFYNYFTIDISKQGQTELKFYTSSAKLEFLQSSPNSFKPGLTYTGFVSRLLLIQCCTFNLKHLTPIMMRHYWLRLNHDKTAIIHNLLCCNLKISFQCIGASGKYMVKILSMRYVAGDPQDFGMSLTKMYIYHKKPQIK